MSYYLMKSEPSEYSIDDLARDGQSSWFGVRNYQARNFMREMKIGDQIFFYHSSCQYVGIVGIGRVITLAHADETQFEIWGKYYEPRASQEKPVWYCVDIEFVEKFASIITLADIRKNPALSEMRILQTGNRLSVTPVTEEEYRVLLSMR